jgi:transcriptional regulator with XRE-family HTH domain
MGRSSRARPARLGDKLREIRTSLDLTLEGMIERLEYRDSPVHPTNISEMERGKREPPLKLLLAYARVAGVSTDVLIDDELDVPRKLHGARKHAQAKRTKTTRKPQP